jgi:hypothetical protein
VLLQKVLLSGQLCTARARDNVQTATELIYLRLAFKYEFASKVKGHVQCRYTPKVHKQNTAVIDEPPQCSCISKGYNLVALRVEHLYYRG